MCGAFDAISVRHNKRLSSVRRKKIASFVSLIASRDCIIALGERRMIADSVKIAVTDKVNVPTRHNSQRNRFAVALSDLRNCLIFMIFFLLLSFSTFQVRVWQAVSAVIVQLTIKTRSGFRRLFYHQKTCRS
jgi:hypothetical protein